MFGTKSKPKFETKTITVGFSQKKLERLVADGWEVVNTSGGTLGTAQIVTLRRPK